MPIEKWHPLKELETMRKEMDRIWEELFPSPRRSVFGAPWRRLSAEEGTAIPAIDVIDNNEEVLVKAEMPGVEKENIDISLVENTLTIKGEIKREKEYKDENYWHNERSYKAFSRSVNIPLKVNAEKIKADLKNGVLTIHLPKAEETRPKKIQVEVS